MKILIICPDWYPSISGFGISCYEFAKRIKKPDTVTIITPNQKNLDKKNLNVIPVPKAFNLLGRNPFVYHLRKIINSENYDVILLYSYMFEMNARVALYRKLGLIEKPVILMYRGSLEDDVLPHLSRSMRFAKKLYDKTYGKLIFKNSDFIISISKPTLKTIEDKYGVSKIKMKYIPSAVNIKDYSVSKLNNKRVLFNGRLIQNKGIKFFDKIAKSIPLNWKFTIIGDGPMKNDILRLKMKYPNIEFFGKLAKEQVNKITSKSDIVILPTFAEGSPRAILEANASGVPSVVFEVGDVATLLNNNKNGYCIPRYDIEQFIEKMSLLISDDKLRKKMGSNAREFAVKNLDLEKTHKDIMKTINQVIVDSKKKKR